MIDTKYDTINCYSFHIKKSTPTYKLFSDKNMVALIYIDEKKSLNFLKIDGYTNDEGCWGAV
jgi:hypothetical protein